MNTQLNHQALETFIATEQWWFSASELHGILTGLVCCNAQEMWATLLFKQPVKNPTHKEIFTRMNAQIEQQLAASGLAYQLLLPPEGQLSERALALTQWAQSMVMALNYVKSHQTITFDTDGDEFVRDLEKFTQLDTDIDDSEENAQLFVHLEEHCRMGALLLYASSKNSVKSE